MLLNSVTEINIAFDNAHAGLTCFSDPGEGKVKTCPTNAPWGEAYMLGMSRLGIAGAITLMCLCLCPVWKPACQLLILLSV